MTFVFNNLNVRDNSVIYNTESHEAPNACFTRMQSSYQYQSFRWVCTIYFINLLVNIYILQTRGTFMWHKTYQWSIRKGLKILKCVYGIDEIRISVDFSP